MRLILNVFVFLCPCAVVQCVRQPSSLPCKFIDERVFLSKTTHVETQHIPREAMLQFGQKGDAPVNPHVITFLVTGGKLDLRRYIEGVDAEQLECKLRRYSTEGIHVRWPVKGDKEYNRWFTCTLRHTKDLLTVTIFLRLPSDQPPSGRQDYHNWTAIGDREILTTTVVMVVKTQSPSVKVGLGSKQKLHCEFVVDHKAPNFVVEWYWQHHGERVKLFSHASRTGQTHGDGVGLKSLASGDASYTLPFTKMRSEGTYVCSVSVNPLVASLDLSLHIEEPPRVSLSTGPTLSLQEGGKKTIICDAENYYPLDVEMVWYEQDLAVSGQRVDASPSKNMKLSSHIRNHDNTFTLSALLDIQASLKASGTLFTCSVSHRSLRVPIRKSFVLIVKESSSWTFILTVGFAVVTLVVIIRMVLLHIYSVRRRVLKAR